MCTFCDQHRQKHTRFIVYARAKASFLCNMGCITLGLACSKSQNDAATFLFFLAIRSHWFSISNFILYSSGEDFIGKTGIIAFCFYRPATIFSYNLQHFLKLTKCRQNYQVGFWSTTTTSLLNLQISLRNQIEWYNFQSMNYIDD